MKALVLAAGRGVRMGAHRPPKCLHRIDGRTLLEWQLDALRQAGVQEIGLVTGYRARDIPRHAIDATFHNPRWNQTNMVASLRCAAPWLRQTPCLVAYGDIVYHPSIPRRLMASPGALTVAYDRAWLELWSARFADPRSDAERLRLWSTGDLLDIGQKASDHLGEHGQFMGLLKLSPRAWSWIEQHIQRIPPSSRDTLDTTTLLRQLLDRGRPVRALAFEGGWCEVDRPSDLALYRSRLGACWKHDWRPRDFEIDARRV